MAISGFGAHLVNQAGGRILAEAWDATGVNFSGTGALDNAGLIEAESTHPGIASVGVRAMGTSNPYGQFFQLTNSGIIRADVAILGVDDAIAMNMQEVAQHVTNQAGGVINGLIYLNRGDDVVTNQGVINGSVFMGEGNDVVDTNGGTINGIVDLFFGDDSFAGGAGQDRVSGDDGNDTLTGNGGNDLLFGGGNDDALTGGTGNDGLFGEFGNDTIVTQAADVAEGGAGDDRITLGDYTFARIDGGDGFDTLVLPAGARKFDLSAALSTGQSRISSTSS